jgi:hypothetical protein
MPTHRADALVSLYVPGRPARRRSSRQASLAVVLLSALVASCGDSARPAATPPTPTPSVPFAVTSPASPEAGAPAARVLPAGVPDTPAGRQLAWVLDALAQAPSEGDVAAHFTPKFIAKVPSAKVAALFAEIDARLAPFALDRVELGSRPERLEAVVVSAKGARLRIALAVEDGESQRMNLLLLRPVIEGKPASSWDDVQAVVRAAAPSVSFLAAEVNGRTCVPISSIDPKKALALGSAFKLYVLYALAGQIAASKRAWTDTIAIQEGLKSLPSGEMRNEPAGKTFTVREFAEKMISVSDNTATDHLLSFVGRRTVEEATKASGHASPARLLPFLSTRDVFALKLLGSADDLRAYVASDVAHKRKLLDAYEERDLSQAMAQAEGWSKPRMIDSIEWFASPEDLCRLMVALKGYADAPATAPVGAILSINPGIPDEHGAYRYIGFKGGSEPGVMNLTWLLQRARDDKWLFLSVGLNDTSENIDEAKALTAASTARDFLAK